MRTAIDKRITIGLTRLKISTLLLITIFFVGCGGSGGGDGEDNSAPLFTNASSVTIGENLLTAIMLSAEDSDGDALVFAISGEDASEFNVNSESGEVTFLNAPDYETRDSYEFTAIASDGKSSVTLDIDINISDKYFMDLAKITASDAKAYDDFGNTVAMDGDYIVVGANDESNTTDGAGSVYVFKIEADGSLDELAKLQADNAESDDAFGDSVAIDGDFIVVGAANEDTASSNAGRAYVFKIRSSGSVEQIARLQADDSESEDAFGVAVAIDGEYIIIGAAQEDDTAVDAGSVYLFKIISDEEIIQEQKIQADDAESTDYFGISLAADEGFVVVGAHFEDDQADDAGSAYLFKINEGGTLDQVDRFQADDAQSDDFFGASVAIDGDYIVVGVAEEDTTAQAAGSAYVFKITEDDSVAQIKKLQAEDAEANDRFGISVSIDGAYIVIGARYEDSTEFAAGSAYLYEIKADDNVVILEKTQAFDAANRDNFGGAVAISGDRVTIAAAYDDTVETNTGSVYLYIKDPDHAE